MCDFDIKVYPSVIHDYQQPPAVDAAVADSNMAEQAAHKLHEHLSAEITQLQSHASNLQEKVDLMSGSIGWRFLNGIRRLLRKNTI